MSTNYVVDEKDRYIEIYLITCIKSGKKYVGQAVSHILNHGRYYRYGAERRWVSHVSESKSEKKNQSRYLNNAIKKHGAESFTVEILLVCDIDNSEQYECSMINAMNTLHPHGYNLTLGGKTSIPCEALRKQLSKSVQTLYTQAKVDRFRGITIPHDSDITKFIRPLNRNGKQYGWYVYINGKKADFGGVHITLDESLTSARTFVKSLVDATHLAAGNPLSF